MSRRRAPLALLSLALLLGSPLAACKKDGASNAPGAAPPADLEKQVAERKKSARAQGLVQIANEDLRKGRHVSASRRALEALESNPQNADAHAILGAARWRAGDFEGSTSSYRKALELEEGNFGAAMGLARNLQVAGGHKDAVGIVDKVLAKDAKQVDPLVVKLRSLYVLGQIDQAVTVVDEVFKYMPPEDPQLPVVQSQASFLRAFQGKGPFFVVEGKAGKSDLAVDASSGIKHSLVALGGEATRAILLEIREECIVDPEVVAALKLKEVGKMKQVGSDQEVGLVLLPEVKFGAIALKNVPAVVQPLSDFEATVGEKPGLLLGRQALRAFGSMTFDFPGRGLEIAADAPAAGPAGASELPLLMLDMAILNAPAVPLKIDGSDHSFFVYFGGIYRAGLTITRKDYLKSGHLPRQIAEVNDKDNGLKMVYIRDYALGGTKFPGVGGIVLVNAVPDANLGSVVSASSFELGGYVNVALMSQWRVTYAFDAGRVWVQGT